MSDLAEINICYINAEWKIFFYADMWWIRLCDLRINQYLTLLWRLHDSGCQLLSNIWGFHSNKIEDSGLLGCYIEQWGYSLPMFWRNILPPPSRVKKSAKYARHGRKGGNMFIHQWAGWLRQERLTSQQRRGSAWHDCVGPEKDHKSMCSLRLQK